MSVNALAMSPDGKTLASGSWDNTIKLWSLPEGSLLKTLDAHTNSVNVLAMSPDGKTLASGSWDKTIKLWRLPEGSLLKTLEGHADFVKALAISPDGRNLTSGSDDKTIKFWSLPEGEFKTCAIDSKATPSDVKVATFQWRNESDQFITYTLPCGSPIPAGAARAIACRVRMSQAPELPPRRPVRADSVLLSPAALQSPRVQFAPATHPGVPVTPAAAFRSDHSRDG